MFNKMANPNKSSYILRLIAGGYLIYLGYGIIKDFMNGLVTDGVWLAVAAAVLFVLIGSAFVVTAIIYLVKHKGDKNTDKDNKPEE